MRVLVVDDDARKLRSVAAALTELGVDSDDIDSAGDAASARRMLARQRFDLLLLDVLLPVREGDGKPSGETSIDLLRQLVEEGGLAVPRYIVAITADDNALRDHEEEFRGLTTQILRVDPAADGWKSSLRVVVEMCRPVRGGCDYDFDVCVQTALRNPEYQAVVESWPASWTAETQLSKGVVLRVGRLLIKEGRPLKVACVHATGSGLVAAADVSGKLISRLRPKVLAMTGVCGGVGVNIGDLIVAEKAWDWQSGKYAAGVGFQSSVDQKDADHELVGHARVVEECLGTLESAWRSEKPGNRGRVHFAPMVSGSSVIADSDMHEVLRQQHRKTAAIDMEAYSVYFASQMADAPAPRAICIKGVSDLADADKKDWAQSYCSYLSARYLLNVVERYFGH